MSDPLDLVFDRGFDQSTDLVFGDTGTTVTVTGQFDGALPALSGYINVIPHADFELTGTFPALTLAGELRYDSNVSRPTVGTVESWAQDAVFSDHPVESKSQDASWTQAPHQQYHQDADSLPTYSDFKHQDSPRLRTEVAPLHQVALRDVNDLVQALHDSALRGVRLLTESYAQQALRLRTTAEDFEDVAIRGINALLETRQDVAVRLGRSLDTRAGIATYFPLSRGGCHQKAMKPLPGVHTSVVVPPVIPNPCYTPSADLLFQDPYEVSTDLLFQCRKATVGGTVTVPVKAVYMISNSLIVTRISDNRAIPSFSSSFSIDADSWTWGFNATIPVGELQYVKPVGGVPVEIAINCNGTPYHFVVEKISRSRSFGKAALTISGRGKSCYLDAPYAPVLSYNNNSNFRTAQQLMEDALTINGVSIGWAVDWGLTDWVVPQGVWSHQGSYISAINAIAQAAGGYVQADRVTKTLHVLPRYPHKPWEWNTATPDFVLPSAVTKNEGIEWIQQPDYNAVYVSGETTGVLGYIKRQGTAGDKPAPMVVDKLITHSDAALQRGISILSNTGPQAMITLSLPVLPSTGIIHPGKYVEYQDGGESFFGIVRSTSVDAKMPSITQTLGVETHV